MLRPIPLFALLSLFPFLLHAQGPPVVSFVFRSSTPPPISVEKFILPPLQELDASARVSVDGDLIKVGFDRQVTEADVRHAINGTGMLTVGAPSGVMERSTPPGPDQDVQLVKTLLLKEQWMEAHPHLYPTVNGTPVPQFPWVGMTDPMEIEAAKQAWMAGHALICPLAPSPRCTGTASTHE